MNTEPATTKLGAVNILLASIGEAPVNQLGSGLDQAEVAERTIEEVMRSVQLIGWNWNREDNYPLLTNGDDEISLSNTIMKVDTQNRRYIKRGQRMYDKVNHTFKFDGDITASVVIFLQFDELPEVARQFITYRAGRIFQGRVVGSVTLHKFTEAEETAAWNNMASEELEAGNYSIFQNAELALMLDRSSSTGAVDYSAGLLGGAFIQ